MTGLTQDRAHTLDRAREGGALILTGKIGSGTIMAAEMENKANGDDVLNVLNWMAAPRGAAQMPVPANELTWSQNRRSACCGREIEVLFARFAAHQRRAVFTGGYGVMVAP